MSKANRLPSEEPMSDINISPLIDMVFILLIFFIVTTVFVEDTGVEVQKPVAVLQEDLQKNSILIAVTAGNQVVYGGREVTVAGVRAIVQRLTLRDDLPVIIQADQASEATEVIKVIDEAKLGRAKRVFLSTDPAR